MASWRIRFHDKWPHLASLYANTHNLDEDGKHPDPIMGQDNVFDPSEPLGAYRYYLAPSQRSEFSIEEPNYVTRSFYKDEESRSSDYTSGDSFRRGSTCRVLLCVFLVFSLIAAVVAAITLAVILSQKTPPKLVPGKPEYYESSASALGETFTEDLTNHDSQEFKDLEARFCRAIEAMFKSSDSPVKHQFAGCEVIEFSNGSVRVRYQIKLSPGPEGNKESDKIEERLLEHFMKKIKQTGPWDEIKWDHNFFRRFLKVEMTTVAPSTSPVTTKATKRTTTMEITVPVTKSTPILVEIENKTVVAPTTSAQFETLNVTVTTEAATEEVTVDKTTETIVQIENITQMAPVYTVETEATREATVLPTYIEGTTDIPFWNYTEWLYENMSSTDVPQGEVTETLTAAEVNITHTEPFVTSSQPTAVLNMTKTEPFPNVTEARLTTEKIIKATDEEISSQTVAETTLNHTIESSTTYTVTDTTTVKTTSETGLMLDIFKEAADIAPVDLEIETFPPKPPEKELVTAIDNATTTSIESQATEGLTSTGTTLHLQTVVKTTVETTQDDASTEMITSQPDIETTETDTTISKITRTSSMKLTTDALFNETETPSVPATDIQETSTTVLDSQTTKTVVTVEATSVSKTTPKTPSTETIFERTEDQTVQGAATIFDATSEKSTDSYTSEEQFTTKAPVTFENTSTTANITDTTSTEASTYPAITITDALETRSETAAQMVTKARATTQMPEYDETLSYAYGMILDDNTTIPWDYYYITETTTDEMTTEAKVIIDESTKVPISSLLTVETTTDKTTSILQDDHIITNTTVSSAETVTTETPKSQEFTASRDEISTILPIISTSHKSTSVRESSHEMTSAGESLAFTLHVTPSETSGVNIETTQVFTESDSDTTTATHPVLTIDEKEVSSTFHTTDTYTTSQPKLESTVEQILTDMPSEEQTVNQTPQTTISDTKLSVTDSSLPKSLATQEFTSAPALETSAVDELTVQATSTEGAILTSGYNMSVGTPVVTHASSSFSDSKTGQAISTEETTQDSEYNMSISTPEATDVSTAFGDQSTSLEETRKTSEYNISLVASDVMHISTVLRDSVTDQATTTEETIRSSEHNMSLGTPITTHVSTEFRDAGAEQATSTVETLKTSEYNMSEGTPAVTHLLTTFRDSKIGQAISTEPTVHDLTSETPIVTPFLTAFRDSTTDQVTLTEGIVNATAYDLSSGTPSLTHVPASLDTVTTTLNTTTFKEQVSSEMLSATTAAAAEYAESSENPTTTRRIVTDRSQTNATTIQTTEETYDLSSTESAKTTDFAIKPKLDHRTTADAGPTTSATFIEAYTATAVDTTFSAEDLTAAVSITATQARKTDETLHPTKFETTETLSTLYQEKTTEHRDAHVIDMGGDGFATTAYDQLSTGETTDKSVIVTTEDTAVDSTTPIDISTTNIVNTLSPSRNTDISTEVSATLTGHVTINDTQGFDQTMYNTTARTIQGQNFTEEIRSITKPLPQSTKDEAQFYDFYTETADNATYFYYENYTEFYTTESNPAETIVERTSPALAKASSHATATGDATDSITTISAEITTSTGTELAASREKTESTSYTTPGLFQETISTETIQTPYETTVKSAAVVTSMSTWPSESDMNVTKIAGLQHTFTETAQKEYETSRHEASATTATGADERFLRTSTMSLHKEASTESPMTDVAPVVGTDQHTTVLQHTPGMAETTAPTTGDSITAVFYENETSTEYFNETSSIPENVTATSEKSVATDFSAKVLVTEGDNLTDSVTKMQTTTYLPESTNMHDNATADYRTTTYFEFYENETFFYYDNETTAEPYVNMTESYENMTESYENVTKSYAAYTTQLYKGNVTEVSKDNLTQSHKENITAELHAGNINETYKDSDSLSGNVTQTFADTRRFSDAENATEAHIQTTTVSSKTTTIKSTTRENFVIDMGGFEETTDDVFTTTHG